MIKIKIALIFLLLIFRAYALSEADAQKCGEFLHEGAQLLQNGNYPQALARFKSALKIAPENPECYYWIGLTYAESQNYATAAQQAEQAVSLNTKLGKAWLLWGQSLMYMGKYPEAKEKLETAYRLEEHNYLAAFNLGRCYYHGFDEKHLNIALEYFRRARDLNKNYLPAVYYLALCQLAQKMYTLAAVTFRDVLLVEPKNIAARYHLGMTYRLDNQVEKAVREFLEVAKAAPDHYDAHLQLAHIFLIDLPNRERFLYHLKEFLETAPQDHEWYARAGDLWTRSQQQQPKK